MHLGKFSDRQLEKSALNLYNNNRIREWSELRECFELLTKHVSFGCYFILLFVCFVLEIELSTLHLPDGCWATELCPRSLAVILLKTHITFLLF